MVISRCSKRYRIAKRRRINKHRAIYNREYTVFVNLLQQHKRKRNHLFQINGKYDTIVNTTIKFLKDFCEEHQVNFYALSVLFFSIHLPENGKHTRISKFPKVVMNFLENFFEEYSLDLVRYTPEDIKEAEKFVYTHNDNIRTLYTGYTVQTWSLYSKDFPRIIEFIQRIKKEVTSINWELYLQLQTQRLQRFTTTLFLGHFTSDNAIFYYRQHKNEQLNKRIQAGNVSPENELQRENTINLNKLRENNKIR